MPSALARIVAALALALPTACRVGPEHRAPDFVVPATWTEAAGPSAAVEPPARWWRSFGDPELESLIERATAANLDLALARARVLEARALRDVAAGGRRPEVDAEAGYSRSQSSRTTTQGAIFGQAPRDLWQVGFDASWEIDLFGRVDRAVEAADLGVEAAEEGRREALVTLQGDVAREYVELRGLQRQIALTRENADAQRRSLGLEKTRFGAGLATDLDVARAETLLSTTTAQIPALEARIAASIHGLCVLLGQSPESLVHELAGEQPIPVAPDSLAAGVPSGLLRRRPDIRRAERELAQATALTAQATAELFPSLTLTGTLGLQSIDTSKLLRGESNNWSIGGSVLAPIFQGGRLRAAVRVQDARQEMALIRYQRTVLAALAEVESALASCTRERERMKALADATASSRRALGLANELYVRGLADFLEVLDAQRSQLATEAELARSATELASQVVALYKALGGGWGAGG